MCTVVTSLNAASARVVALGWDRVMPTVQTGTQANNEEMGDAGREGAGDEDGELHGG
jgi:hypothetical protein